MSKETKHNSEANIEVRELKDELRDGELDWPTASAHDRWSNLSF